MKMKRLFASFLFMAGICAFVQATDSIEDVVAAGQPVVTGGWADMGKMAYPKAKKITVIDDKAYPKPLDKRKAFTKAISKGKSIVVLSGDVDLSDGKVSDSDHSYFDKFAESGARAHKDITYPISSNVTLIGVDNARIMFGGIIAKNVSNVIIRNVTFYDAHGSTETDTNKKPESKASIDNLNCENVRNLWVDHCTFTDGVCVDLTRNFNHDGAFDVKKGANITVSYCEFTNHDKVMLTAPGDSYTNPNDCLMTLHHNYFHGTTQRMPRSRGCKMHVYNNVYDNIGVRGNSGYCLGPGIASMYIIEGNAIGSHQGAIVQYSDKSKAGDKTFSKIYFAGNMPESEEAQAKTEARAHLVSEKPWEIPYEYSFEDASGLNSSLPEKAGAGKKIRVQGYN